MCHKCSCGNVAIYVGQPLVGSTHQGAGQCRLDTTKSDCIINYSLFERVTDLHSSVILITLLLIQ